jgi:hypothetical protein
MQWFWYALLTYSVGQVVSVMVVLRCNALWRGDAARAVRPRTGNLVAPGQVWASGMRSAYGARPLSRDEPGLKGGRSWSSVSPRPTALLKCRR